MADVGEQLARLNTLMRFHQYDEAIKFAYKFRLDMLLSQPSGSLGERARKRVQECIDTIEGLDSKQMRMGKRIWDFVARDIRPNFEGVREVIAEMRGGQNTKDKGDLDLTEGEDG